jgi:hypothetical protein
LRDVFAEGQRYISARWFRAWFSSDPVPGGGAINTGAEAFDLARTGSFGKSFDERSPEERQTSADCSLHERYAAAQAILPYRSHREELSTRQLGHAPIFAPQPIRRTV